MKLSRTQKLILSSLRKGKKAAVSRYDLANEFGMTELAVRKDLALLCNQYPICGGYNITFATLSGIKAGSDASK